jgi:hypothetical protein
VVRLVPWALELPLRAVLSPAVAVRMGIQKQEFYEGAALHQLIRGSSGLTSISHSPPFFVLGGSLQIHLKYSTAKRSPWGFTFMPDEQLLLQQRAQHMPLVIGLICGADGVAAIGARILGCLGCGCRRNFTRCSPPSTRWSAVLGS